MNELARRAVACKGWRWLPGMLDSTYGYRKIVDTMWADSTSLFCVSDGWHPSSEADLVPDLTDPATLGCLLSLVRDAWDEPLAWVYYEHGDACTEGGHWRLTLGRGHPCRGATEAAALVAALEAAP